MTRMTGPDCVVMCNLINTHTHTVANRSPRGLLNREKRTKEKGTWLLPELFYNCCQDISL